MTQIYKKIMFFYDFYIPMDTDEFIVSIDKNFEIESPLKIKSELETLRDSQGDFKFHKFYYLMN